MLTPAKFMTAVLLTILLSLTPAFAADETPTEPESEETSQEAEAEETTEVIQLRPTNIDNYGRLYFDQNIYIDSAECEKRKDDLFQKGEVLFNNTNSQELVGRAALVLKDLDYGFSNHITRIRVKEDLILSEWLAYPI